MTVVMSLHLLDTIGAFVVHPELLSRKAQCDKVQQCCNPAVEGILLIALVHVSPEQGHTLVLLLQVDILNQGHALCVEEDSHDGELDYSPDGQDNPAQGQFGSTDGHLSCRSESSNKSL